MDYKELEKQWQKDLPEEANGMTKRKPIPKRWLMKLKSYYRKVNAKKEQTK
mgnify:CR=1 FL=1